ncbi:MAG: PD40 domain-containing protein [Rhodospirillaceae bacterium]|nr:PD40 domain-containing protein [Rhodospirillaceae bacterium]
MKFARHTGVLAAALLLTTTLSTAAMAHPGDEPEEFPLLAPDGAGVAGPEAPLQKPGRELPMKPARKIEFVTDEGTWISLDVAPDGKTIVFELLGDLYTMDSGGGTAKAITRGFAFDAQPVFSPDGAWISYISDKSGNDNVWISRPDGSDARQISFFDDNCTFTSPAWSADGSIIYASRYKSNITAFEMWSFNVDDGKSAHMAGGAIDPAQPHDDWRSILGIQPSADGRFLYYSVTTIGQKDAEVLPLWKIQRQPVDGGAPEDVAAYRGSALRPVLSPDGKLLVYAARYGAETGLRLRDLETGTERWLAWPIQRDDQEYMASRDTVPGYAFTPDGQALILAHHGKIRRFDIAAGTDTIIPFSARVSLDIGPSQQRVLNDETGPVQARLIQTPVQSPDGQQAAFSAFGRIYVAALPSDHARPLVAGGDPQFQPSWSADGKWLHYVTWTREHGGAVWKAPLDGSSAPQRLSEQGPYFTYPVPTPDGTGVLAVRSNAYERDQAKMEVVGLGAAAKRQSQLVLLTPDAAPKVLAAGRIGGQPHFTQDPSRVYILIGDKLHAVAMDGSGPTMAAAVTGAAYYFLNQRAVADDIRISPDGRWLLVQNAQKLYLIATPKPGTALDLSAPGVEHRRITSVGADFFGWADGGRTITWAIGSTFYRKPVDRVTLDDANASEGPPARVIPGRDGVDAFKLVAQVPRDRHSAALVLRGANVVTMRPGEVIRDADIVIAGNRVKAVGARGQVRIPPNAAIRDVAGKYIVPGFVDTHMHWGTIRRGVLEERNWNLLQTLAYGITTALDPSSLTIDTLVYQDMEAAGLITAPRIFTTGPALFSFNELQSPQEALDVLSRFADHYRIGNLKEYRTGNRRVRQWVAEAARDKKLLATTEGALDMKLDLTQIMDGYAGSEHALTAVPLYRDVIELLVRTRVGYTPTLQITNGGPPGQAKYTARKSLRGDAKLARFTPPEVIETKTSRFMWFDPADFLYPRIAASAAAVQRAGGLVGVGSHGEVTGLAYHWELQAYAEGGMTPAEILQAATIGSAEVIGRKADIGSIEPGKYADLLILDADPLADISNTTQLNAVMKNGRLYDALTLDEVWPRQKLLNFQPYDQPKIQSGSAP